MSTHVCHKICAFDTNQSTNCTKCEAKEAWEASMSTTIDSSDMMADGAGQCGGAIGLVFMGCSAASFSIMSMLVHLLSSQQAIPSFELVAFRGTFGLIVGLIWTYLTKADLSGPPEYRGTLLLRCIFGILGISSNWYTLSQMSLGDATVIIFTAPVFTAILATVYLGEKLSLAEVVLMTLSCTGVMMVARPSFLGFEQDRPPAYANTSRNLVVLIGLFGAFASAVTNLLVRRLLAVHAMVTVTWLMGFTAVLAPALLYLFQTPRAPTDSLGWFYVFGIGALGFLGQGFKTQGLKWEKAGPGTMMRNLDIVFAFGFQHFVFDEEIHMLSLVGATITLTASLAIGVLKLQKSKEKLQSKISCNPPTTSHSNIAYVSVPTTGT
eukprot:m.291825 g.291825  ORF g.291825 m.291825 type:complete len:380 (+) comp19986_c0_seq7:213-1352(+)